MHFALILVGLLVAAAPSINGVDLCNTCKDLMDIVLKRVLELESGTITEQQLQQLITESCVLLPTTPNCTTKFLPLIPQLIKLLNDGAKDPGTICCKLELCQKNSADCSNSTTETIPKFFKI